MEIYNHLIMSMIKNFYHDEIEQASREADDYEYRYKKWCDEQQEIEKQRYFEEQFNKQNATWQSKIKIQLKSWKFLFRKKFNF
jgi:hypothetical protein